MPSDEFGTVLLEGGEAVQAFLLRRTAGIGGWIRVQVRETGLGSIGNYRCLHGQRIDGMLCQAHS